jgi:hypothetical protein
LPIPEMFCEMVETCRDEFARALVAVRMALVKVI